MGKDSGCEWEREARANGEERERKRECEHEQ